MRAFVGILALGLLLLSGCIGPSSPREEIVATNEGGPQFVPPTFHLKVQRSVTFRVVSGSHTVDFQDTEGVSPAKSGNLDPGQTHTVTFGKVGTFRYFCLYHSVVGPGGRGPEWWERSLSMGDSLRPGPAAW